MRNKKKNRIYFLLILLLGITVGFAALATTLKINGNAGITKNTWSVYWDKDSIAVTQGSKGDTTPTVENGEDGSINTKVNWNVNLELPGDFYEFTIDAVNAGTLDAMINLITPTLPQDLPSYVSYSVTYADGVEPAQYHLLPKGTKSGSTITPTTEKYKVRIEFLNTITPEQMDAIPEEGLSFNFGYEVQYGQADSNAIAKPVWILPNGKTANNLTVGDELCVQDQCFNFVSYDGNDAVLLAKYNLKVGKIYNTPPTVYTYIGEYTSSEEGYGLQSSETIPENGFAKGVVPFSTNAYWDNSYDNIYDSENYVSPPEYSAYGIPANNNYSIAYYVEQYKEKLTTDYHATIKSARVLTISDLTSPSIGCTDTPSEWSEGSCPTTGATAFINNNSLSWIATAQNYEKVKYLGGGTIINSNYQGLFDASDRINPIGVRPVIIVEKSNL